MVGSPIDGIKDWVGPIVEILDVCPEFILRKFCRERSWLVIYPVPSRGQTPQGTKDRTQCFLQLQGSISAPISNWSARTLSCAGEEIKITRFILDGRGRAVSRHVGVEAWPRIH